MRASIVQYDCIGSMATESGISVTPIFYLPSNYIVHRSTIRYVQYILVCTSTYYANHLVKTSIGKLSFSLDVAGVLEDPNLH